MPGVKVAALWYKNAHTRFGPPGTLTVARLPFVATGVLAALAQFGFGSLIGGRRLGVAAAVLLAINPLFRLHAHRAMSDVPCEAFLIAGLALALWGAERIWSGHRLGIGWAMFAAAGACSGLSIACKLNGVLAPMIVAAWCGLGELVPRSGARVRVGLLAGASVSLATMLLTLIAVNPTLTCRPGVPIEHPELAARAAQGPWGRFRGIVKYRLETTVGQQQMPKFEEYVVRSPADKVAVVAVQGFGRFGPFGPPESDSTVRYDLRQDWGMALWAPLVVLGAFQSCQWGRRQLCGGKPPTALAPMIWAMVSLVVVTAYLPLAWDRYLLPIQAPNAVLGAVGLSAMWERWFRKAVQA
jgi:4-amino-4-deoxy-L-arabinose transferase-like glycosyltransferase